MNVSDLLPRRARLTGYLVSVLLGVALGAITVGFATATGGVPLAVTVAAAVYAFLSTAAPVVALFNLNAPIEADASVDEPELDEPEASEDAPAETPAAVPTQFR